MSEQTIFLAALDISDPAERAAYVTAACGDNQALRKEIEGLLAAHERPGAFLDSPAVAQMADSGAGETRTVAPWVDPDGAETRAPDSAAGSEEDVLAFLQPPTRPGSLGRLKHYEVQEVLGRGGFGTVLKAFDDRLHRVVAIKVLAPQLAASGAARKRFERESKSTAAVRDDHVVNIHAVSEDDEPLPYLVMEFVSGQTLQQKLDKAGPLSVAEVLRIGSQIARGLAAAHATGLIHRDIKPANILLENGVERVKITDFGLARAADDASISQSGVVAGTPQYMAPEQARGDAIDHRADLFSLGSVLYAMCTGRPPFRAETTLAVLKRVCEDDPRPVREVNPQVPQWLADVVAKLHAKNPADRFQSAKEVADLLADCGRQLQAHGTLADYARLPGGAPKPVHRRIGRRRKWAAAALVLLALGATLAGIQANKHGWENTYHYLANESVVQLTVGDPNIEAVVITKDGEPVETVGSGLAIRLLPPGHYQLQIVTRTGHEPARVTYDVHGYGPGGTWYSTPKDGRCDLIIQRGSEAWVSFTTKKMEPSDDGFVPLFNGKDLTGWKVSPELPGDWRAEHGVLVGRYAGNSGYLFSERGDYENFHLRAVVKIGAESNGGILFRCASGLSIDLGKSGGRYPPGYEVDLVHTAAQKARTGALWRSGQPVHVLTESPVRPGDWFTVDVFAQGNSIRVTIDGAEVVRYFDTDEGARPRGHIGLQVTWPEATEIHFRKIEIKELPPNPPAGEWVQLFNGKNLTGWKTFEELPGDWRVEDGVLVGREKHSYLVSEREFENFHFRAEFKVSAPSDAGVYFRSPGRLIGNGPRRSYIVGYEAQITETGGDYRTGDLCIESGQSGPNGGGWHVLQKADRSLTQRDEWFHLEILAQGDLLEIRVNGRTTAKYADTVHNLARGHIALQVFTRGTVLQCRKAEIKELPPDPPAESKPRLIKAFTTADKPLNYAFPNAGTITAEEGGWKIVSGANGVTPLFSAGKPNLQKGTLTFRGKMRSANLPKNAYLRMDLMLGNELVVCPLSRPISGVSDWADFESSFVMDENHIPDGATLNVVFDSRGTVWIKDVELLYLPAKGVVLKTGPGFAPPPAVAPFDAAKAKAHQDTWAKHLGVPVELENSIGMKLRLVPPGTFLMGTSDEEVAQIQTQLKVEKAAPFVSDELRAEPRLRRVELKEPFYVGVCEVTTGQFRRFVADTGYKTDGERSGDGGWGAGQDGKWARRPEHLWKTPGSWVPADEQPVVQVSYDDARAFCAWLGKREGREYAVPTEDRWEFAARAGTTGLYGASSDPKTLESVAWTLGTLAERPWRPQPVGTKKANAFGLHDMLGNVNEWCADRYDAEGTRNVLRGGGWNVTATRARVNVRSPGEPDKAHDAATGFRVIIVGDLKPKRKLPAKEAPNLAVLQPLRDAVAARARTVAEVKLRFEAAKASKLDVLAAQVDLREANIKLAEAEGDSPIMILHLRELVKLREEERDLIATRVKVSVDPQDALNQADARLADARARLAKVSPPEVAPPPRPKP